MTRFTSPDLSRELYDAGMPDPKEFQNVRCGSDACHRAWGGPDAVHECTEDDCVDPCYRALDLTDILEELTREREGGALVGWWSLEDRREDNTQPGREFGIHCTGRARVYGPTAVEAAGLVLLALLREKP